jgi:hypothetical protein
MGGIRKISNRSRSCVAFRDRSAGAEIDISCVDATSSARSQRLACGLLTMRFQSRSQA